MWSSPGWACAGRLLNQESKVPVKKSKGRPTEAEPDLIPGHGGKLTFVEDGVIVFIPKSFIQTWPAIAVKISKKGDRITLERHETVSFLDNK